MVRESDRWKRMALGCSVPVATALACQVVYDGVGPACIFRQLTGLYCPGCGSGRAISAVLHGHLLSALACNPLLFLLGIPALSVFLHEYLRLVFPRSGLKPITIPQHVSVGCVVLVALFWILRNISAFGFLAPGT